MDKPIIIDDKIDNGQYAIHRLMPFKNPLYDEYGLCIIGYQRAGRSQARHNLFLRHFEFYCISHLIEGRGFYYQGGGVENRKVFESGSCVIVSPGHKHCYGGYENFYCEDAICFCGPLADFMYRKGFIADGIFQIGHSRRLASIVEMVLNPAFDSQFMSVIALQRLLMDIYHENRDLSGTRYPRLAELLMEIKADVSKWWSVSEMAEFCKLSEVQFRRIFKEYTGTAPKEYLDLYKIRKASEMLSSSELTIEEIARALGYLDPYHFSRRFKELNGLSPDKYRKQLPA